MSLKLFELSAQYKSLEALAETDDLAPEFIADTLDALTGQFEDKAVAVAKFILSLEAAAEDIEAAAEAMHQRAARIEKRAESIRQYLLLNLQVVDAKRIETSELVIRRQLNPVAVRITDEHAVPADYWRQLPAPLPVIDKKLIKDSIQNGIEVPGAYLEAGEHVRISY